MDAFRFGTSKIETGLPWWYSGQANVRDMGLIPGLGRFHMWWTTEACAPQLLSPRAATTEARHA